MAKDRASRPGANPRRLFVAVDIPDDVRASLFAATAPLRDRFPKARWVPPENWHVTMKFLGRTWPRIVDWVEERIEAVAAGQKPFETAITELGSFPSSRRARVLWAGLDDSSGGLAAIAGELDAALEKEFDPEKREFAAHLTIARSDPPIVLDGVLEGIEVANPSFAVDRLVLYESHLRRPAPVYEPLREVAFWNPPQDGS